MNSPTCFYCEKEILPEERRFLLGLERPYINIWFHREHYNIIKDAIIEYFTENEKRFLEHLDKHGIRRR